MPPEVTAQSSARGLEFPLPDGGTGNAGETLVSPPTMAKSVIAVSLITMGAKICGFGEKIIIAHFYGTSGRADVYFAVLGIVWSIVFIVKELVYPAFLPVYSRSVPRGDGLSGALFGRVFWVVLTVLMATALILLPLAPGVIGLCLPGFAGWRQRLATSLLRGLLPGTVCAGLMVVTYAALNARKKFTAAAVGDAMLKLGVVVGLLALTPIWGMYAIGPSLAVAGLLCVVGQLLLLPDKKRLWRPNRSAPSQKLFRDVRHLATPLVLGVIVSHASALVDNALASTLPAGELSYLAYGKKIIDAVMVVGPVALVTVVYSKVAGLNAQKRTRDIAELMAKSVRVLLFVSIPLTGLILGHGASIVRVLFQRGQFDAASTSGTALALGVYSCGLVVFALEALLVYCFYGLSDTRTPVLLGVGFVLVDIGLAVALLPVARYLGIAAALVISKAGKVIVLGVLLSRRRNIHFWTARTFDVFWKVCVATGGAWLTTRLLVGAADPGAGAARAAGNMAVVSVIWCLSFLVLAQGLGIQEGRDVLLAVRLRVGRIFQGRRRP